MCRKLGNHWVEYMDPIDLMDCSSNMQIGYVGTKEEPTMSGLIMLWIIDGRLKINNYISFYNIYCRLESL